MHPLAIALIIAAAEPAEVEALDDELNAVTMMSIGGGFVAVGAVTAVSAVVAGVVAGVVSLAIGGGRFPRVDESTLADPASPASVMLPPVAALGAIALLSAAELGVGTALLFWGRGNYRDARQRKHEPSQQARPAPVFDPDRLERRTKKNSMGYDQEQQDSENRRVIVED
jgi:hypothetical protein